MTIHNFTEFYNLLKNNDGITNTVPKMKDFVLLTESYKAVCSCNRKSEKLRMQALCETEYRSLVNNVVPSHIQVFKAVLKQNQIKFLFNNGLLKDFNL